MNKAKYIGMFIVGAIAAVGFGVYAFSGTANVVVEGDYIEAPQPEVTLGAQSGPDWFYPYMNFNGVETSAQTCGMASATTTLCAVKNPFSATSTVAALDWEITTGTSTAATIVANVSTGAYASSTTSNFVDATSVASGAQDSTFWNNSGDDSDAVVGPGEWVLVQTEGAGLGGYTYDGNVQVVFRKAP